MNVRLRGKDAGRYRRGKETGAGVQIEAVARAVVCNAAVADLPQREQLSAHQGAHDRPLRAFPRGWNEIRVEVCLRQALFPLSVRDKGRGDAGRIRRIGSGTCKQLTPCNVI